jgi:hypothetical protein
MVFLALVMGCAVACAGQAPAGPLPPELPVSVERIRERLKQPAVVLTERQPDFRANVTEEVERPETVLESLRRELGGDITPKRIAPGTISPPLVTVDLLQIASHVKRQLSAALRARAERNARAEVAAALAEFCAEHDCSVVEQSRPRRSDSEGGNNRITRAR